MMCNTDLLRVSAGAKLRATIHLPASKSISNRALVISALTQGGLTPQNLSDCDDTRVCLAALASMPEVIDIGAAGTAMRFLTALLCTAEGSEHVITGSERMRHRPIAILVDALRTLGASVDYVGQEGFPPLRIRGKALEGGEIELPGNVSSQYVSALLMIGSTMARGLRLRLTGGVASRPYIDMTLALMQQMGAQADWEGDNIIYVRARAYEPVPFSVEGDWSAASYWYEMVALTPDSEATVVLPGLCEESLQGDSRVRHFFEPLGVSTSWGSEGATIRKGERTATHVEWDLTHQPDLAQTLVATCCALGVTFRMRGVQSLKIKETDRIEALKAELGKLGYVVRDEGGHTLTWDGLRKETQACPVIKTYDDHRMAMALAPLCLTHGTLSISDPRVVSKSYPTFWGNMTTAGFVIEE